MNSTIKLLVKFIIAYCVCVIVDFEVGQKILIFFVLCGIVGELSIIKESLHKNNMDK